MTSPGEEARHLASPSHCPGTGPGLLPLSRSVMFRARAHLSLDASSLLLALPLLEQDFLWHCPCILTCPSSLARSGCVHSKTQIHGLVGVSGTCLCMATPAPSTKLTPRPRSPLLWVSLHLILPFLHPSTFYNILVSSTVLSYLLLKEGWGVGRYILAPPPFPMSETSRSPVQPRF